MKKTIIIVLLLASITTQAQRVKEVDEINLHLEMASRFQIASGSLLVVSVATLVTGLLLPESDTKKFMYMASADCAMFSGACLIASGHYLKRKKSENTR